MKRLLLAAAVALAPALAGAQDLIEIGEPAEAGMDRDIWVQGQGGLHTYTGEAANYTTPGAAYGVLVGADVTRLFDVELGYQGAAYSTDSATAGADNTIVENGGQVLGMLRPAGQLQPYAFGGFNVSRLSVLEGDEPQAGAVDDATLYKIPVGVGVSYHTPSSPGEADFMVGVRGTYNISLDSGAFEPIDDAMSTNQLQTTLQIGASF